MRVEGLISFAENNKIEYTANEPMALHTSFKLGGEADLFLAPETTNQFCDLVSFIRSQNIPCFILGNGSNLLVSDRGIEGAVISTEKLNNIKLVGDCEIFAESGATLAELCKFARDNSLTGLEFAYGIPGTVGGALYMNAGAYGGDMSQVVSWAESFTATGEILRRPIADLELGYRKSIYKQNEEIITGVGFKLAKGNRDEIAKAMDEIIAKRIRSQPLEFSSAGSTFKRPEGYYAAALIDECGLKGKTIGGAQVSEKHAGFVINKGDATCDDVLALIEDIKQTVKDSKDVDLQTEVIFVGRK